MKNKALSLFNGLLMSCFLLTSTYAQNKENKPADVNEQSGYKLVWADEFNTPGRPDSANWDYEHGYVRNKELQDYQKDNVFCENGCLIIEARREKKTYTSSSIHTLGKRSWQYGRFVMRAKIDISEGLWPAWWTLGTSGKWPSNGEIDIMEYYQGKILANIAVGTQEQYKALWYSKTKSVEQLGGKSWASKYHIWRMDWDENEIALYVDDQLLNRVSITELYNRNDTGILPFKQPHYMILNLAIGGINGGSPEQTIFPKRFEVDYVRVYQKPNQ